MVRDSLTYLGPVDLMQYFVKSYSIVDQGDQLRRYAHGNEGVKVDFIFSRRLLNQGRDSIGLKNITKILPKIITKILRNFPSKNMIKKSGN